MQNMNALTFKKKHIKSYTGRRSISYEKSSQDQIPVLKAAGSGDQETGSKVSKLGRGDVSCNQGGPNLHTPYNLRLPAANNNSMTSKLWNF